MGSLKIAAVAGLSLMSAAAGAAGGYAWNGPGWYAVVWETGGPHRAVAGPFADPYTCRAQLDEFHSLGICNEYKDPQSFSDDLDKSSTAAPSKPEGILYDDGWESLGTVEVENQHGHGFVRVNDDGVSQLVPYSRAVMVVAYDLEQLDKTHGSYWQEAFFFEADCFKKKLKLEEVRHYNKPRAGEYSADMLWATNLSDDTWVDPGFAPTGPDIYRVACSAMRRQLTKDGMTDALKQLKD